METTAAQPAIQVTQLSKTFRGYTAFSQANLRVDAGEMVALVGASGSGKSTLLRCLNGLQRADQGRVEIFGSPLQLDGKLHSKSRQLRSQVGFIFQQFNLVGRLTALENVLVGGLARLSPWRSLLQRFTPDEKIRALAALEQVGILSQAYQRASSLSGGQQQRVAIARCLMQGAKIVLADEPIASLDPESAAKVMALLTTLNRQGITVIVSLHQVQVVQRYCPRAVALRQGQVCFDGPTTQLDKARLSDIYGTALDELVFQGHSELVL